MNERGRPELSAARWRQAEAIFEQLVVRPPDARLAGVDALCGDDIVLAEAVRGLLRADAAHDPTLGDATTPPAVGAATVGAGRGTVGAYRLLERIGAGGMSVVHRARHRNAPTHAPDVALKLLPTFAPGPAQRLVREGQILARLDHPNIAHYLDAGVSDEGQPYVVMAYVDGQPLDAFCDAQALGVEARLRLFERLAGAVRYLHQNLVVHRDLKPANVLVTDEGVPRLLDFGIAKLLANADDPAADATRTVDRFLTPAYASPEQLQGEPVSTASDIYGLGVLLYVLLCGVLPHRVDGSVAALIRSKRGIPVLPSVVAGRGAAEGRGPSAEHRARSRGKTAAGLAHQLRGDLDAIVLRCLRFEPAQRYASVDELLDDLRRRREGQPVTARAGGVRYRLAKSIRRHALVWSVATLVAAGLGGFAFISQAHATRLAEERDVARRAQAEAEDMSAFLSEVFLAANPTQQTAGAQPASSTTVREVLDRSAVRLREERRDQPRLQAKLMTTIAIVYNDLGEGDRALALHEEALAIRQATLGPGHPETLESLNGVALAHLNAGDADRARALLMPALESARRLPPAAWFQLAVTLKHLGAVHEFDGDFVAAAARIRESLALFVAHHGDASQDAVRLRRLLANVLTKAGDFAAATAVLRTSIDVRVAAVGADHPDVANLQVTLGDALRAEGRLEEARAAMDAAVPVLRETSSPWLIRALHGLAIIGRELGRLEDARAHLDDVMPVARQQLGPDHPMVSLLLAEQGLVLIEAAEPTAAESVLRDAKAMAERAFGRDHYRLITFEHNLGLALFDQARWAEAEASLTRAVGLARDHLGGTHPTTGTVVATLADLALARGGVPASCDRAEEAVGILTAALPAGHHRIAQAAHVRGGCLAATGDVEGGVALMRRSQAELEATRPPGARIVRRAASRLARWTGDAGPVSDRR